MLEKTIETMMLDYKFFKRFNSVPFLKCIRPGRNKGDNKITDIRTLKVIPEQRNIF